MATCITSQVALSQNRKIHSNFILKEPLASSASHAGHGDRFPGRRPPVLPAFRSAVFPRRASRQGFQQVVAGGFEFRPVHAQPEEENPHVVLRAFRAVGALVFRARALGGQGFRGDHQAELDVGFYLSGVRCAVERANLHRAYPPYVVQVDRVVAHGIVMARIRILVAEPCFVQRFFRAGLCLFEAVDEPAVGALGVAVDPALKRSRRLEDQLLLLVPDSGEIRDLARGESADPDVDVLAGAVRRFRSGFAEFPNHRLQGFHVVPFQNRRHHLGARRAASEAAVADRFPVAAVRRDHRPFVVAAAGEPNLPADHRVDRLGRPFAADVRVLQFRPEGEFLRRLDHRVGHNSAFHRLAC